MASRQDNVDRILDRLRAAGGVSARRMFGEFGLYLGGVLFALVCDDVLYLKPTAVGRDIAGDLPEAAPYPGAKPYLVVSDAILEDGERLVALVRSTVTDLPAARPRKPRGARTRDPKA